jgi:UDP-3-O-[3-hydroxymyristoyl] glucosamine N-acyltransferase
VTFPVSLADLAHAHGGRVEGGDRIITGVASIREAGPAELAPFTHVCLRAALPFTRAGALLTPPPLAPAALGRCLWVHPEPALALARILADRAGPRHAGVHPRAVVDATAEVAASACVEAGAVVGLGAMVGDGSVVGANAVIGPGTRLGRRVIVGPGAVVGADGFGYARDGDRLVRIPHQGIVDVEDDVEIGANATIARATLGVTRILRGTKIDCLVHVGHNVEVGPGALLAAQAGVAGSSTIGAGVQVGGQAGVADHCTVGPGARLAAKAGVIGDVPAGATVGGYPAVDRGRWLREQATLARLTRRGRRGKGQDT